MMIRFAFALLALSFSLSLGSTGASAQEVLLPEGLNKKLNQYWKTFAEETAKGEKADISIIQGAQNEISSLLYDRSTPDQVRAAFLYMDKVHRVHEEAFGDLFLFLENDHYVRFDRTKQQLHTDRLKAATHSGAVLGGAAGAYFAIKALHAALALKSGKGLAAGAKEASKIYKVLRNLKAVALSPAVPGFALVGSATGAGGALILNELESDPSIPPAPSSIIRMGVTDDGMQPEDYEVLRDTLSILGGTLAFTATLAVLEWAAISVRVVKWAATITTSPAALTIVGGLVVVGVWVVGYLIEEVVRHGIMAGIDEAQFRSLRSDVAKAIDEVRTAKKSGHRPRLNLAISQLYHQTLRLSAHLHLPVSKAVDEFQQEVFEEYFEDAESAKNIDVTALRADLTARLQDANSEFSQSKWEIAFHLAQGYRVRDLLLRNKISSIEDLEDSEHLTDEDKTYAQTYFRIFERWKVVFGSHDFRAFLLEEESRQNAVAVTPTEISRDAGDLLIRAIGEMRSSGHRSFHSRHLAKNLDDLHSIYDSALILEVLVGSPEGAPR